MRYNQVDTHTHIRLQWRRLWKNSSSLSCSRFPSLSISWREGGGKGGGIKIRKKHSAIRKNREREREREREKERRRTIDEFVSIEDNKSSVMCEWSMKSMPMKLFRCSNIRYKTNGETAESSFPLLPPELSSTQPTRPVTDRRTELIIWRDSFFEWTAVAIYRKLGK